MKIRDRLGRTSRMAMIFALLCWLGFVGIFVVKSRPEPPLAAFVFFVGFAGAVLFGMFRVKCPMCGFRLGRFGLVQFKASSFNKRSKRVNYCPHCGLDLDREMEA